MLGLLTFVLAYLAFSGALGALFAWACYMLDRFSGD